MEAKDRLPRFDTEGVKAHFRDLAHQRYFEEGRKAGMKEVVEWVEKHRFQRAKYYYQFEKDKWQAFLKGKGIE